MSQNGYAPEKLPNPLNPQFELQKQLMSLFIESLGVVRDMEEISKVDVVSGLQNRGALEEAFSGLQHGKNHRRPGDIGYQGGSLVVMDIDNFSTINSRFGHLGGDTVFRGVGDTIRGSLHRKRDVAARLGSGDEIALLLPRASMEKALEITEDARAQVANKTVVTLSAGVAEIKEGESFNDAYQRADAALYAAKEHGRNQTIAYDPSIHTPRPEPELETLPQ